MQATTDDKGRSPGASAFTPVVDPTKGNSLTERFLSSCDRLPRIGFAVGVALLLGSLAGSAHAELMFISDLGENTITAVRTNTVNYAPASALLFSPSTETRRSKRW